MIHTVKGFSIVTEAEVDVFLEFCFFCDPIDVGNMTSGSSAFLKSSLYIWNFSVHVLLKHDGFWACEVSAVVWQFEHSLVLPFFGIGITRPFPILWPLLSFPNLLTGILSAALSQHHLLGFEIVQLEFPSPPLALFLAILPKAYLTSHSRMSGSRWMTPSWLSRSLRPFLYNSSVCSCHLFLISSASVRSLLFLSFIVPIFAWNVPWYLQLSWRYL